MTRCFRWVAMMALAAVAGCGGESVPPDVVLVTIDTLRADHLGCYGYDKPTSPHLDALAAEGLRYDQCQAPAPITLPSHASILTGQLPSEHGVRNNGTYRLPDEASTLAEALRAHGYRTGAFVSALPVSSRFGLAQGFEVYDDALPAEADNAFELPMRPGIEAVDAAGEWIDTLSGEAPVFVWVHLFEPHMPYTPPPPFDARFAGAPYDGEVAAADDAVGRLLQRLEVRGSRPRLTMVTSDHGEGLGEHGEDTHAMFLYQTTLRVPWIVHWPKEVPAGKVEREPVGLIDVAPTVLALAGIDPGEALQASGLALDPHAAPPHRRLMSESVYALETYRWSPMFALREGSSKVIRTGRTRAFDLAADPGELHELEDAPWSGALVTELEGRVRESEAPAADATRALTPEETEALAALGYVGSTGSAPDDLWQLTTELADPAESLDDLRILQQAEQDVASGRAPRALDPLRKMLARTPDNVRANAVLGRALAATGDTEGALRRYERAAALRPGWFEVLRNLARLSAMAGKTEQAVRVYEQALQANGADTGLWLEAAGLRQRLGQPDQAIALLERALVEPDLDEGPAPLHEGLARLLLQAGRLEEGREHLVQSRQARPDDPRLLVLEALYLEREGRWQAMVDLLAGAEPSLSTSAEAQLHWGVALQMLGRSKEALGRFEAALALDDSLALAHNAVAWIDATEQHRAAEALPHARRAIQLQPAEPEFHDTYLEVLERLGRRDEARDHLAAVLGRFPHHAGLRQRAVRYGLTE
jgi:arylsulfatase A-like enzyme/tetratricopeptide (TPR) repeat protein